MKMLKAPRALGFYVVLLAWAAALLGGGTTALGQTSVPATTVDDRVLGKADAPITIFEYASLTCPHCAAFATGTMPQLEEAWIKTGKAKLVFRDYPLDKLALTAAIVARCVPADRFFGLIKVLFADQPSWGRMSDADQSLERVRNFAGLTKEQADACVKDTKLSDFVLGEHLTAKDQYGVSATPTFFINGEKVVGERDYPDFEKLLLQAAPSKP
jgi:protein-disulfide isomerase